MATTKEQEPSEQWGELKAEIITRITAIDAATEYQSFEPQWWLEMMAVRKAIQEQAK